MNVNIIISDMALFDAPIFVIEGDMTLIAIFHMQSKLVN